MFPVVLDVRKIKVAVVGSGVRADRRAQQLREGGAEHIAIFSAVPDAADLQGAMAVFAADMTEDGMQKLSALCRDIGVLLNVEDRPDVCDFHVPAIVRRGDLLLSVSTGGKSPGAAAAVREWLEESFGAEWAQHLDMLAAARRDWRAQGLAMDTVAQRTRDMIDERQWL